MFSRIGNELPPPERQWLLHRAAASGSERIMKLMIENGTGPSARAANGEPALGTAVNNGHATMVRLLLGYGAFPDPKTRNAWTERNQGCGEAPLLKQCSALLSKYH